MFYYLHGTLALTEPGIAVIDCNGVGYQLSVSSQTLSALFGKIGTAVKLYTHLAVREDAMELFGFATYEELTAFRMLTTVSGVGPKAAMAILSLFTPEKFALAVATGDIKGLSRANGVGAKTAARIVLELKDKIAKDLTPTASEDASFTAEPTGSGGALAEAVNALMVLGFSRSEAMTALKKVDPTAPVETMIRDALRKLNG